MPLAQRAGRRIVLTGAVTQREVVMGLCRSGLVLVSVLGLLPAPGALAGDRQGGGRGHSSKGKSASSSSRSRSHGNREARSSSRPRHRGNDQARSSSRSRRDDGARARSFSRSHSAQTRHPRAGTGTGWRYNRGHNRGYDRRYNRHSRYYRRPSIYLGFGWPGRSSYGYYGYGRGYGYRYGYGYGYGYGHPYAYDGGYDVSGAIRVQVDPEDTEVYVDGYYAGTADDFDGTFQRLRLAPGRHEIALSLDGYRTFRVEVYATPGQTINLRHDMEPGEEDDRELEPGEDEPRERNRPY
jgi:hypothetical protein